MSKDANSFGHDKALAWESRGFVYTKRGCIVSTHPHTHKFKSTDQIVIYDKAAGYSAMAILPSGELLIIAEAADGPGFTTSSVRPAGWLRLELFILSSK